MMPYSFFIQKFKFKTFIYTLYYIIVISYRLKQNEATKMEFKEIVQSNVGIINVDTMPKLNNEFVIDEYIY